MIPVLTFLHKLILFVFLLSWEIVIEHFISKMTFRLNFGSTKPSQFLLRFWNALLSLSRRCVSTRISFKMFAWCVDFVLVSIDISLSLKLFSSEVRCVGFTFIWRRPEPSKRFPFAVETRRSTGFWRCHHWQCDWWNVYTHFHLDWFHEVVTSTQNITVCRVHLSFWDCIIPEHTIFSVYPIVFVLW